MRSARFVGSVVALVTLVASACGVRVQDAPTAVPEATLPVDAADQPEAVTPDVERADVYFVQADRLLRVERRVRPTGLNGLLSALAGGPNSAEVERGIRTAVPPGTRLRAGADAGSLAVVDVSEGFLDVTGEEQILAIAQVVFTATSSDGVASVVFRLRGELIEVPRADGVLSPTPVSRDDYEPMRPPS